MNKKNKPKQNLLLPLIGETEEEYKKRVFDDRPLTKEEIDFGKKLAKKLALKLAKKVK